jgi:hypothetical protein
MANCSLKAVKELDISWNSHHLYILTAYFMIELFFRLERQFYEIMYSFLVCCGGLVVYSKIRQIRETGFTSRDPLFEKS